MGWPSHRTRCVSGFGDLQDVQLLRDATEAVEGLKQRLATYRQILQERAQVAELAPTIQANEYVNRHAWKHTDAAGVLTLSLRAGPGR